MYYTDFRDKVSDHKKLSKPEWLDKDIDLLRKLQPHHSILLRTIHKFNSEEVQKAVVWELLSISSKTEIESNRTCKEILQVRRENRQVEEEPKEEPEQKEEPESEPEKKSEIQEKNILT